MTVPTRGSIAGVTVTVLRQIADERGAVLHMVRADRPDFAGFGECYFSEILPGAVKAWKRHRLQTQTLGVPSGRIRLAIFDDREASDTKGVLQVLELGRPDAYVRVQIPPSLWYGFACLGEQPALVANCADLPHHAGEGETRPTDDASIPYRWRDAASASASSDPKPIRLSKSCLGPGDKLAVMQALDREYLGMGSDVRQFEEELSAFFRRPVVCVVNGSAALQLAVQCCGIGPGDEVLVPSLTFVASFQAISATGATPVACDIDSRTCMLDWRDAERRTTPRTKAVMPVHYGGDVCDQDGVYGFARRHDLRVIEDAAHAFGTTHQGRRIGSFGDIACFSFDGIKTITSGEGGCVITDDTEVLRQVRDARLLGIEKDTDKRYAGQRSWEFDVTAQGWRYHMSNIMAALGRQQLARFAEFAEARQRLARRYDTILAGHPRITPLARDYDVVVPHIYVVRLTGVSDRKLLQSRLRERGIETGTHYQPNHQLSFYTDPSAPPLPATDAVFPELLSLPLHPDLTEADVELVCAALMAQMR